MPSGTQVVVRSYTPDGSDAAASEYGFICGFSAAQIKAVVEYAYGILVANADLYLSLACEYSHLRSSMACACRRLDSTTDNLTIAVEPTGGCPREFGYSIADSG